MSERLHRDYWTAERAVEAVDRFAIAERARLSLPTVRRALIEARLIGEGGLAAFDLGHLAVGVEAYGRAILAIVHRQHHARRRPAKHRGIECAHDRGAGLASAWLADELLGACGLACVASVTP